MDYVRVCQSEVMQGDDPANYPTAKDVSFHSHIESSLLLVTLCDPTPTPV